MKIPVNTFQIIGAYNSTVSHTYLKDYGSGKIVRRIIGGPSFPIFRVPYTH